MISIDEKKLKDIIISNSNKPITYDEIKDESDFIEDFGFDSLSLIEFIVQIEEEFKINLEDSDLLVDTIGRYKPLKELLCKLI
jgi:acyl carrier protein